MCLSREMTPVSSWPILPGRGVPSFAAGPADPTPALVGRRMIPTMNVTERRRSRLPGEIVGDGR